MDRGARNSNEKQATYKVDWCRTGNKTAKRVGLIKPKLAISDQTMKVFGIYILTDRTLRILLEFARNTELNEIVYRKVLDEGINIEQSISSSSEPVYLIPSSYPLGTSLFHR
jgi:hypothetical protein